MSASSVSRHSSTSIATSAVVSPTTLLTTLPSVFVTAVWAPTTSVPSRAVTAPVGVRVKNAMGIRCTLRNSAVRRSKISPSPMCALHQRCTTLSAASPTAATTAMTASTVIMPRSSSGIALSMIRRTTSGGASPSRAAARIAAR